MRPLRSFFQALYPRILVNGYVGRVRDAMHESAQNCAVEHLNFEERVSRGVHPGLDIQDHLRRVKLINRGNKLPLDPRIIELWCGLGWEGLCTNFSAIEGMPPTGSSCSGPHPSWL